MTDKAMNLGGFQQPAGYQPVPQQAPIHPVTAAPNVQYGAAHYYPAQVHATPSTSSSGGCSLLGGGCHSNSNNANWSPDSHPVFMLPENELLDASSSKCGKCLIRAFNRFYRGGFSIMFYFILIVSFLIAPFFGMAVALFELGCHAARVFARPLGKLILDMSGVGIYLNKRTEYMEVRTNILRNKKVAQVEVV